MSVTQPTLSQQEAQFEALIVTLTQFNQLNYATAAALTVLAFDVVITFGDEVKYIWQTRWSLPKFLFLFSRWWAVIHLIFIVAVGGIVRPEPNFCKFYYWFYATAGLPLLTISINTILILRVHSLYERSQRVLLFLVTLLACETIIEYYVGIRAALVTMRNMIIAPPGVPIPGCLTQAISQNYTIPSWCAGMISSSIFFGMMLFKFGQLYTTHRSVRKMPTDLSFLSPLLVAFFRDGVIFFFLPFASVIITTVSVVRFPGPLAGVGLPWGIAIYGISACRLVLGLREAAVRGNPSSTWEQTLSSNVM